jgi:hypothetical protein
LGFYFFSTFLWPGKVSYAIIVGGGQTSSITFKTEKLVPGGDYTVSALSLATRRSCAAGLSSEQPSLPQESKYRATFLGISAFGAKPPWR